MMNRLKNKKILILGASVEEVSLVRRAQSFGIYTIVTDYYTDHAMSPAKDAADEAWDVSWSDLDTLERLCRENHVDGITAGYSEFRVENMIRLCERLDLPCYATMHQLDITRDKVKFKDECRKCGVPVVTEYASPAEVRQYPVIVKPVDRGGSIGISVANNAAELERAYAYAMEMSVCKQVIIEDFISDGTKFDSYYSIMDGEIQLLSTDDVINAEANGTERVVQSSWLFPSRYHAAYEERVDASLRRMIQDMGIQNGYIFFSGFYRPNGEFVFFETGFRLCGGHLYHYLERKGLVNNLDIFISHALTGNTQLVKRGPDTNPDLKCVTLNFYAKAGKIAKMSGISQIGQMEDCILTHINGRIGQECNEDRAILSKIAMFSFCSTDPRQLRADADEAYRLFATEGTHGEDMIYDRIHTSQIETWWA